MFLSFQDLSMSSFPSIVTNLIGKLRKDVRFSRFNFPLVPFSRTMLLLTQVSDDKEKEKAERKRLQIVHAPKVSNRAKLVAIIITITIINFMCQSIFVCHRMKINDLNPC